MRKGYVFTSVCHSVYMGVGGCMAGGGGGAYVWQGVCVAGGMHGRGGAWWGVCGQGACIAGGMCGVGNAWQERRPLQRPECILLECILVQDINFKCKSRMQRCLNLRFFGLAFNKIHPSQGFHPTNHRQVQYNSWEECILSYTTQKRVKVCSYTTKISPSPLFNLLLFSIGSMMTG